MLLSLILPVYNVEAYLGRCIESCLNQDLPKSEYEIIVVIDGSPDNSIDVAKRYQEKNKKGYKVGDLLEFRLNYMSVLRILNSKYIDKKIRRVN